MWLQKAKKDGKQRVFKVPAMQQLTVSSGVRVPWTRVWLTSESHLVLLPWLLGWLSMIAAVWSVHYCTRAQYIKVDCDHDCLQAFPLPCSSTAGRGTAA
jgi:hypothetical protein